jgi:aldose 1-epimerase
MEVTGLDHPIVWLHHAGQRLGLVPTLGGGVAAWQLDSDDGPQNLWRPWDGVNTDRYSLASFAMLPWSNRISAGGFEHAGRFHPMTPNRAGEPYPIHGDGWLQSWTLAQPAADTLVLSLESHGFDGNPYHYGATQHFTLLDGGLDQSVTVTHLGEGTLPYGLGLHPWFLRSAGTRLTAPVQGVWLSGADPLPTAHTPNFPATWDLREGIRVNGSLVDNGYTGWAGRARIDWPEQGRSMTMTVPEVVQSAGRSAHAFCLLYRPPVGPAFCFEPVTHPIDAFHLEGRPGLKTLAKGESLSLDVQWRFEVLSG